MVLARLLDIIRFVWRRIRLYLRFNEAKTAELNNVRPQGSSNDADVTTEENIEMDEGAVKILKIHVTDEGTTEEEV
jgi:hypothetical protein